MIELLHLSSHDCPCSCVRTHPLAHVLLLILPRSQCTDCTSLDLGYTTLRLGALTSDQCVCKSGYFLNYVNATYVGGVLNYVEQFCDKCDAPGRIGYDCRAPGNALESLRIKVGYTRSHNLSTRVRQCFHKAFCTPPNTTNATTLALINIQSNLGVCAPNHAGPYCEVCVQGYIMSVEGCVACEGSRALSFIFPVIFLVFALGLGIYLCRSGRAEALAMFAESVIVGAKQGDESIIEDGLQQYYDDRLEDATACLHRKLSAEHGEPECVGSNATPSESKASTSADLKQGTSSPVSPPTSPPLAAEASQSASCARRRLSSLIRHKSILRRSKAAAVRRGCTPKRIASAQTKFRIIVSLIQVLGQLGIVFSIPYPDFYSDLISILGVFSLEFLEIMPLECSFGLNHDYYLLIRTLLPLAIALVVLMLRRCLRASAARKRKAAGCYTGENEGKAEKLGREAVGNEALADQLLTFTFIIFYLLYPSNSANIFATFQCETLDDPEQSSFLRKDFKVDCKSSFHQYMMYYAAVMIFVYPVGIPCVYIYLLFFKHGKEMQLLKSLELERCALKDEQTAADNLRSAREIHDKSKASSASSAVCATERRSSVAASLIAALPLPQSLHRWRSDPGLKVTQSYRSPFGASRQTLAVNQAAESLRKQMDGLQREEDAVREGLPDYVQKLILGYELRTFYFEILECFRKLAIVCLPVFFQPSGSVSQLIFGLVVCFLTSCAHMVYAPYVEDEDDRLAQLCQAQIFFALLSSIALKYDAGTLSNAVNMDILLTTLTIIPCALAFVLETPLADLIASNEMRDEALVKMASSRKKANSALRWGAVALKRSRTPSSSSVPKPKPYEAIAPESELRGTPAKNTPGLHNQISPTDLQEPLAVDTSPPADVDVRMESYHSDVLLATFGEGPVGITMDRHNGAIRVIEVEIDSQAEAQGVRIGAGVCEVAGRSTEGLDVDGVLKLMLAAIRPVVVKFDPPPAGSAKLVPLSSPKRSLVAAPIARVRKPNAAAGKTSIPVPVTCQRNQKISAAGKVDGANTVQTRKKEQATLKPLSFFHKEHTPPPPTFTDSTPAHLDRKLKRMWMSNYE